MLGVVPSIVRSWRTSNCTAGLDWSSIRYFSNEALILPRLFSKDPLYLSCHIRQVF